MVTSLKKETNITRAETPAGEVIEDPDKILEEFKSFYEKLCSEDTENSNDKTEISSKNQDQLKKLLE